MKKKGLIIIFFILLISIPISIMAYNSYNSSKYYDIGLSNIKEDKFDEAVSNFNTSLKYGKKFKKDINDKINLITKLKTSKSNFQEAEKLMQDKKYLHAIESFNKVIKEDEKRYELSLKKADESKKLFIKENIDEAKKSSEEKKYNDALNYLDVALKEFPQDEETLNLQKQYKEALKRQKEEEARALQKKKEEEEKAKKAAEEADRKAAEKAASSIVVAQKKSKTLYIEYGDGRSGTFAFRGTVGIQPFEIIYDVTLITRDMRKICIVFVNI